MSILLMDNAIDFAVINAASEQPTAPARYLRNRTRSRYWRSEIGDSSAITFVMPAALPIDYLAAVDVNLRPSGSLHWEAWDDAIDGASQTIDISQPPSLYDDPNVPSKNYGGGYGGPYGIPQPEALINVRNVTLKALDEQVTSRYWRLTLSGAFNSWQQCSYIFIGLATQYPIDNDWSVEPEEQSVQEKTVGGQIYTDPRETPQHLRGQFDFLTEAQRDQAHIRMRLFGKRRPFIFSIRPDEALAGINTTVFGRFSDVAIGRRAFNQNTLRVGVLEDL